MTRFPALFGTDDVDHTAHSPLLILFSGSSSRGDEVSNLVVIGWLPIAGLMRWKLWTAVSERKVF